MIAKAEAGDEAGGGGAGKGFFVESRFIPAKALDAGLYLVATPIGNLGDVTLRGLATLAAADLVACEDTRVTRVLLDRYGIRARLSAYHEHNAERQRPKLLGILAEGKAVALVSDAGTPLVSDPGYRLVVEAVAAGIRVVPVPGASAVMAALVTSGLPTDAFLFAGFLPVKEGARRKRLAGLARIPATLVVFEAPQRIGASLADMAAEFGGDRGAVVARELTKAFETVRRGTLTELAAQFAGGAAPKGEIVILVAPPGEAAPDAADADRLLAELLKTQSVKEAASEAAAMTGLPRRDLYRRALVLRERADSDEG